MKKAIAEKWVKALLSKKYKQGKGALKIKTKAGAVRHCCLGVLCELYQQDRRRNKKPRLKTKDRPAAEVLEDTSKRGHVVVFGNESALLPKIVQRWAGMHSDDGVFPGPEMMESLAAMNDDGENFAAIADAIECNVAEL